VFADVLAHDPMIQAQGHETAAAAAKARRAGAFEAPMLELMVENVPTSGGFGMDPMTMRVVGLEQRVTVSGVRTLERRAAEGETRAQEAQRDDVRWQRLSLAWQAYADAYWAGQRARRRAITARCMDRMAAAAKARYESGRGRLEDMLRVESQRARIEADAVTFEAEAVGARARLAELRGLGGDGTDVTLAEPVGALAPIRSRHGARSSTRIPRAHAA
jgi:hypothetical protein